MPIPIVAAGLISAGASIISGIFGSSAARKAEREAADQRKAAEAKLRYLENNRQEIINPYENTTDLSGMLSNPMENLSVATQAAEMQIEEADISLANTLDTIRASGASAGGATALAQAALQSKKGVSASIEIQEAANEKARAQGEVNLQQQKLSEAQRIQQADAQGKSFEFNTRENRQVAEMDRVSAQLSGAQARESQAQSDRTGAITGAVGGALGVFGSMASAGAFSTGEKGGGFSGGDSFASLGATKVMDFSSIAGSDKRLKKNIIKIGESSSGLNIYNFEYLNPKFGKGTYQGVMSDEVPAESVLKGEDGYDRVDYSKLDVEFKKLSNEL